MSSKKDGGPNVMPEVYVVEAGKTFPVHNLLDLLTQLELSAAHEDAVQL